jgi:hypothetical protein
MVFSIKCFVYLNTIRFNQPANIMTTRIKAAFVCLFILLITSSKAQIGGAFTVPGSFPTLAAAINTLNLLGVAAPVTINVSAGYTETVPVGGLRLLSVPGASAANQITFQKSGSGAIHY